jgi:hypothetical protein
MVLEDRYGRGPVLAYQPWGNHTWDVSTESNMNDDLQLLELFNRVVVPWTTPDGADQTFVADASDVPGLGDKLVRSGIINEYLADSLEDPQADNTLAAQIGYTLLQNVADYRVQGTIQVGFVQNETGVHSPYAIDAGDLVNLTNFEPQIPAQRVVGVTYTPSDVKCDIGQDVSASGKLAKLTNEQLRNPPKRGRRG